MGGDAAALADSPILFPSAEDAARLKVFADLPIGRRRLDHERLPQDHRRLTMAAAKADAGDDRSLRSGRKIPYLLLLPGMLFTFVFFVVPLITLLKISLSTKPNPLIPKYDFTWEWSNFSTAFTDFGSQLLRSFYYAGIATVLCLVIAYPVAYFIAFKAGKWRNILLGLVMVPFFTSFLLRTIAWQTLLADNGPCCRSSTG